MIDSPKQFVSGPKRNTIEIAKEQVSEANQLTFTSNSPASVVSGASQDKVMNSTSPSVDSSIFEIAESICDQDSFRENPFRKINQRQTTVMSQTAEFG